MKVQQRSLSKLKPVLKTDLYKMKQFGIKLLCKQD